MSNPRIYGVPPYSIVVVHGGPGAAGDMAAVATELSRTGGGVLEPLQTALSVDAQVEELRGAIEARGAPPVTLIGYSWGAWLSLLVAARHPVLVKKLVLIGSGPFEDSYAEQITPTRLSRLNDDDAREARALMGALGRGDANASLVRLGELLAKADAYDPLPASEDIQVDDEIYRRVWSEAAELRRSGRLFDEAQRVRCPVVAIHGDYDPHPGEGVRVALSRVVTNFRFIPLAQCGHTPWLERQAKSRFYDLLRENL